jgi:hypothetical protein
MQLLTVFLIIALSVIATTLIIISIKLTDLVAETKASRIAIQNIEADDLFQQGHFSEHQRKEVQHHSQEILTSLQRIEDQLALKLKTDRARTSVLTQAEPSLPAAASRLSNARL